mgnify:CR=1 FL=1
MRPSAREERHRKTEAVDEDGSSADGDANGEENDLDPAELLATQRRDDHEIGRAHV